MRLLLLEPDASHRRQVATLLSAFSSIDSVSSVSELRTHQAEKPYITYDATVVCRGELLSFLSCSRNPCVVLFLPLHLPEFTKFLKFPLGNERILRCGELTLSRSQRQVWFRSQALRLRKKEFLLLETFLQFPHITLRSDFLLKQVWDSHNVPMQTALYTHLSLLRQTLRRAHVPVRIRMLYGVGYRLETV